MIVILAPDEERAESVAEEIRQTMTPLFFEMPEILTVVGGEAEKLRGLQLTEADFVIQCAGWDEDFELIDSYNLSLRVAASNPWVRWAS